MIGNKNRKTGIQRSNKQVTANCRNLFAFKVPKVGLEPTRGVNLTGF